MTESNHDGRDGGVALWKEHSSAFDRVQSVAMTVSEPRPVGWIAREAHVAENTARSHLERLASLDVLVADDTGRARTYYPDPIYVRARELRQLVDEHDPDELSAVAESIKKTIEDWETEYDVSTPAQLRATATDPDLPIEASTDRRHVANDWEHARYRLGLVREALADYDSLVYRPPPTP
jgi:predicted ArsR family transcriptional regulator